MVTRGLDEDFSAAGYLREWARWADAAATALGSAAGCLGDLVAAVTFAGGKVFACGNGGSAADAAHFAGELVGRLVEERAAAPGLSLGGPSTVITALANDYGVEAVFARQLSALAGPGDCLLALTTSGRSPNILAAIEAAKRIGLLAVAVTGPQGLPAPHADLADLVVRVPLPAGAATVMLTPHVQEVHIALLHAVAARVEQALACRPSAELRIRRPRRQAVLLDRDGTLVCGEAPVRDPDELVLLPGAAEAVRAANHAGIAAVVITNQAAVGRGELTAAKLDLIHRRLRELLAEQGAVVDAIYYCPHPPGTGCCCRKPLPGMILRAAADLHLDLGASLMVGDAWSDVRAGLAAGAHGCLVLTGLGASAVPMAKALPQQLRHRCLEVASVYEAMGWLLDQAAGAGPAAGAGAGTGVSAAALPGSGGGVLV